MAYKQTRINARGIFDLFQTAISHRLKFPHVRLQTTNGSPVALKLAGAKSRHTGNVFVTDGGRFGENRYYGRIDQQGTFHSTTDASPELFQLLARFAEQPAEVAAEYGRLTGNCCFCGLQLTDVRSTAVGYGPVCADHFGLAWGEDKQPIKLIDSERPNETSTQTAVRQSTVCPCGNAKDIGEATCGHQSTTVFPPAFGRTVTVSDLLADNSTPYWAKDVINVAVQKDPIDAANVFDVISRAFATRANQILHGGKL